MKVKYLAAACAALCSAAAFAAPLPTNTGVPAGLVTYYISGASAQAQAVSAVLPTTAFFAVPADVVKLTGGSVNDARFGMSNPAITGGVSKPLLIVYRNSNGSGSGVRQLLAHTLADVTAIPNADNTALVTLASCGATTVVNGTYTATCTSVEARVPDVALSDVNPIELPGTFPAGAGYETLASLVKTKNALQGFGLAVNPLLYAALVAQNAREGHPVGADGQPSISKAVYASLISAEGSIKDANGLLNTTGDATEVVVCRRTDLSGTQATSNNFFLNNVCGTQGYGGSYNPLGAGDSAPGQIVFSEGSSTGNAKTCVNTATGYRVGVLSLENVSSYDGTAGKDQWRFVKIDGVSPTNTYNGSAIVADLKQRQQLASGAYPYALEMYSAYKASAPTNVVAFAGELNSKLGDSTLSDLVGIAYEDLPGTWVGNDLTQKQTRVTRGGNNCAPLLP